LILGCGCHYYSFTLSQSSPCFAMLVIPFARCQLLVLLLAFVLPCVLLFCEYYFHSLFISRQRKRKWGNNFHFLLSYFSKENDVFCSGIPIIFPFPQARWTNLLSISISFRCFKKFTRQKCRNCTKNDARGAHENLILEETIGKPTFDILSRALRLGYYNKCWHDTPFPYCQCTRLEEHWLLAGWWGGWLSKGHLDSFSVFSSFHLFRRLWMRKGGNGPIIPDFVA